MDNDLKPITVGLRAEYMAIIRNYNQEGIVPNNTTTRQMENNAQIRASIEKIIMDANNLQDDLIEKYLSPEAQVRRTTRDVWELRRRFSIITSDLRRLKSEFIPGLNSDDINLQSIRNQTPT